MMPVPSKPVTYTLKSAPILTGMARVPSIEAAGRGVDVGAAASRVGVVISSDVGVVSAGAIVAAGVCASLGGVDVLIGSEVGTVSAGAMVAAGFGSAVGDVGVAVGSEVGDVSVGAVAAMGERVGVSVALTRAAVASTLDVTVAGAVPSASPLPAKKKNRPAISNSTRLPPTRLITRLDMERLGWAVETGSFGGSPGATTAAG